MTTESTLEAVPTNVALPIRPIRTHWHALGKDISSCKTVEEAISSSELNWQVGLLDVYIAGTNAVDGIKVIGKHVAGIQAIQRLDNGDVIGSVGRGYCPIQNTEMFSIFDGIIDTGGATFDRAGAIASNRYPAGSRVFFAAKLDKTIRVGGDNVLSYIYGKSGHDGGQALSFSILDYVQICSNGMMGLRNTNTTTVRHTKNAGDRMEDVRSVLGFAERHQEWLNAICENLFNAPLEAAGMNTFVEQLLPPTKDSEGKLRISTNLKNKREKIVALFTNGTGQNERGRTRWAALNAVTEFVDHTSKYSSKLKDSDTARYDSCLEGSGAALKERALELLSV